MDIINQRKQFGQAKMQHENQESVRGKPEVSESKYNTDTCKFGYSILLPIWPVTKLTFFFIRIQIQYI